MRNSSVVTSGGGKQGVLGRLFNLNPVYQTRERLGVLHLGCFRTAFIQFDEEGVFPP